MTHPTPPLNFPLTPTHAPPATLTACASTRLEPPFRPRPRRHPKAPPIPTLTPEESVALAQFIQATTAGNTRTGWRTAFDQCVGRGHFRPLATPDQTRLLRNIVDRHGPLFHCYLRKADVLAAAHLPLPRELNRTAIPVEDTS